MCFLPSLSASVVGSGGWGSVERAVEVIREVGGGQNDSDSGLQLSRWVLYHYLREGAEGKHLGGSLCLVLDIPSF